MCKLQTDWENTCFGIAAHTHHPRRIFSWCLLLCQLLVVTEHRVCDLDINHTKLRERSHSWKWHVPLPCSQRWLWAHPPLTPTLLHRCCCHRKWVETWGEEPPCLRSLKNVWGHEVAQMCVALLIRTDVAKTSSLLYPLAPVKNVSCPFCYSHRFSHPHLSHSFIFSLFLP